MKLCKYVEGSKSREKLFILCIKLRHCSSHYPSISLYVTYPRFIFCHAFTQKSYLPECVYNNPWRLDLCFIKILNCHESYIWVREMQVPHSFRSLTECMEAKGKTAAWSWSWYTKQFFFPKHLKHEMLPRCTKQPISYLKK